MEKKEDGTGIPNSYRKDASDKTDVLWKVEIRGQKFLVDDIPLHMSLRVFDYLKKEQLEEVKQKIKSLKIETPDPKDLEFEPIIFYSKYTDTNYYMLKIKGVDGSYKEFFDYFKKGYGFSHDSFMPHITINKELYDSIKENPLKPDEIKFKSLSVEKGIENTLHKTEELEKGLKHVAAGVAAVGAMATAPTQTAKEPAVAPTVSSRQPSSIPRASYSPERMLRTIATVESNKGKMTNHKQINHGINSGEKAFGKYGLTPSTIRETVQLNPDLKSKHAKIQKLKGEDLRRYMEDNKGLEDTVAGKHLQRLQHHFGNDPATLGYAWLQGVHGTYKAKKEKQDIANHWHAKKITDAYEKEK